MTVDRFRVLAPAKINLCLHVLGRREDGYHQLAMLMERVSLCDVLELTVRPGAATEIVCGGVPLAPGEENLAGRAARRLLEASGVTCSVAIEIDKRIPVAAGLGGGSSDAAAVLLGLNRRLELGWKRADLMRLGAELGADVPFFIFERRAWATGIGEVLEPAPALPPLWYLLVNPEVAVSTAWVYQNLDLTGAGDVHKLREFPGTPEAVVRLLHNDLEKVTMGRLPVIAEIKRRLLALGAAGALMSGSGPTVFGVFGSREKALRAREDLAAEAGWRVFLVEPLADGPAGRGTEE